MYLTSLRLLPNTFKLFILNDLLGIISLGNVLLWVLVIQQNLYEVQSFSKQFYDFW